MSGPARFKIGDRVRVVVGDPDYGLETGSVAVVDSVSYTGGLIRLVEPGAVRFGAWRFELVTTGDRNAD
ncbi:MAG: hypothetical protein EBR82_11340 [Caulobacteraceae bacterium]|nr:hypothetical protein [Caulobacteraceae bacterium]